MSKIVLELTDEQFAELHQSLDHTRSTSTTVRVDREALRRLLSDHSKLVAQDTAYRRPWAQPVAA